MFDLLPPPTIEFQTPHYQITKLEPDLTTIQFVLVNMALYLLSPMLMGSL